MTNQTIPPCPVCGTVPEASDYGDGTWIIVYCCGNERTRMERGTWLHSVTMTLGIAAREAGITTIAQLNDRLAPDPRVAVLEKKLAKLTDKLEMVEQESEQRLSAIIGYSDQLLAMKEKYEPAPQSEPHPDGCFSSDPNDVQDCETDGHYSCKDCKRNSRIAAQRWEE